MLRLLAAIGIATSGTNGSQDFEGVKLQDGPYVELGSTYSWTDPATQVGVTIIGGAQLRVYDLVKFAGDQSVRGQALIDWIWDAGSQTKGTTIRFDRPVIAVELDAGDWFSDDDDELVLEAFDCHEKRVARTAKRWAVDKGPPFAHLVVDAKEICFVRYHSGGPYANSTFIDNLAWAVAAPPSKP